MYNQGWIIGYQNLDELRGICNLMALSNDNGEKFIIIKDLKLLSMAENV